MSEDTHASQRLALRFIGSGSEYFRIWIVNLLLILVTLGLYYPFAKVRRMKYFHGATELAGQPFGFHADPWKMFRGHLLVLALVAAYTVAGEISPIAGLIALCIVLGIWPALWHSSLRFRFANTSWRGLRFHFRGTRGGAYRALGQGLGIMALAFLALFGSMFASGWMQAGADRQDLGRAALDALGMLILLFAVYFVALPASWWLLQRYRQRHLALGDEHTAWNVGVGPWIGLFLKTLAIGLVPLAAIGLATGALLPLLQEAAEGPPWVALAAVAIVSLGSFSVVMGFFTARQQNLVWNGTSTGHLSFRSRLSARRTMGLTALNWLLTLLTLGLYRPFAQVAMARLRLHALEVRSTLPLDQLAAQLQGPAESAAGDAAGDLLGWDIGL